MHPRWHLHKEPTSLFFLGFFFSDQQRRRKISRLPWHELFSRVHRYDHCVSCRLWGLNVRNLASSVPLIRALFCACEVTRRVAGCRGVIIKRWALMFSLANVWWNLLITRFEDLARALWGTQRYKLLTPAGGSGWWTLKPLRRTRWHRLRGHRRNVSFKWFYSLMKGLVACHHKAHFVTREQ